MTDVWLNRHLIEAITLRRLIDLDKERRDLVFSLAHQHGTAISDVLDILEMLDWDNAKARAALADHPVPSAGRSHPPNVTTDQGRS